MAIIGLGIDAVELSRISKAMSPRFVKRILTVEEQMFCQRLSEKRQIEYVAGRFAAKEAYAKARGTGIGEHVSFQDIAILNDGTGKPYLVSKDLYRAQVSITHTSHEAQAIVILEEQKESD